MCTYSDPRVALAAFEVERQDVLVLNGRMPQMHGLELFLRLHEPGEVPVIFLSANAERIAAELARRGTPAEAYVDRPFSQSDLLMIVEDLLGPRQLPPGAVHLTFGPEDGDT